MSTIRPGLWWAAGILFVFVLARPAVAQLQIGDSTQMSGNGSISIGYSGSLGLAGQPGQPESASSGHALDVGGQGTFEGYYYNPRFLSFTVNPYYSRSQNNSDSESISDSSGYSSQAQIFNGSRTPGYVSFNQNYDSSGTYGIANLQGMTTHGNNRLFQIGWGFFFSGLPTLHVSFEDNTSQSNIYGDQDKSNYGSKIYSVNSNYTLKKWDLSAAYSHSTGHSEWNQLVSDTPQETSSSNNNFNISAMHRLPMHGTFTTQYRYFNYTYDYESRGQTTNGHNGDFVSFATVEPFRRFTVTGIVETTSDTAGGLERAFLESTGTLIRMNESSSSGKRFSATANWNPFGGFNLNSYASHSTQTWAGQSYSVSQYGGGGSYTYGRSWMKGLNMNFSAVDTATQQGNVGMGFVGNVNYTRALGEWMLNSYYSYSQNTQTLDAVYTTSGLSYGANARRKLSRNRFVMAGFAGSHNGLEREKGAQSHVENYWGQFNARFFSLSGSYAKSYGRTVQTASGLINVPTTLPSELISPDNIFISTGNNWSVGASSYLFRRLSVNATYSEGHSNSTSYFDNISNFNSRGYFKMHYRLRKLTIDGGYTRLWQNQSNRASSHSVVDSYYIGISRWFNLF